MLLLFTPLVVLMLLVLTLFVARFTVPVALNDEANEVTAITEVVLFVDLMLTGLDVLLLNRITLEGAFGEKRFTGLGLEARRDA